MGFNTRNPSFNAPRTQSPWTGNRPTFGNNNSQVGGQNFGTPGSPSGGGGGGGGAAGGAAASGGAAAAGLTFAQRATLATYGVTLGWQLSEQILQLFGQSPNIVTEEQEQRSINQHGNKQITSPTPPAFSGGQIPGMRYLLTFDICTVTSGGFYWYRDSRREAYGPIGGFSHGAEGTPWQFTAGGQTVDERWLFKANPPGLPGVPDAFTVSQIVITRIDPLGTLPPEGDLSLPAIDPGITSPANNPGGSYDNSLLTPPNLNNTTNPNTTPGRNSNDDLRLASPLNLPSTDINTQNNTALGPDTINLPNTTPRSPTGNPWGNPWNTPFIPPLFYPPQLDPQSPNRTTDYTPIPPPNEPSTNTPPEDCKCSITTNQKLDQQDKKLDDMSNKLILFDIALDTTQLAKLDDVLDRLGPKVNGGLSGFLGDKFAKLWNSKALDRALALLNLAASLHNALMLSRNIGETLLATIANVLALIGIKDPEGTAFNLQQMIGKTVEDFLKAILGAENYVNLTETWKKANRIYQAAINVYQLLTDSIFAVGEGLELIGKYNAQVGNALKKSGAVLENAYDWMSETFNFKSKRNRAIDKVIEGLQDAQEVASDLQEITSEFREAAENITEIKEQVDLIKKEISDEEKKKKEKEDTGKTNSLTPDIPKSALITPAPPPT